MKRTRPIRGKYFLTIPRITHEGRILEIKVKLSQVIVTDMGPAKTIRSLDTEPRTGSIADIDKVSLEASSKGEIERGRVDGDEEG